MDKNIINYNYFVESQSLQMHLSICLNYILSISVIFFYIMHNYVVVMGTNYFVVYKLYICISCKNILMFYVNFLSE